MTAGSGPYVDGHATGWTELRVHGVSGTPPEAVLEHPTVVRVAGYTQAGFLRRWWEARAVSVDTEWQRREGYSWGGLTSGDNTRALWLLLLPFMLLNVAFYMAPSRRPPDLPGQETAPSSARRREHFSGSVQRLLALSFTATFTLTAVSVGMDLVGWQCAAGRSGGDVCGTSWLAWLTWSWLDRPGRQVAVTALLPLALVGLLWWAARTTWRNLEAAEVAQSVPDAALDLRTPLEDRAMWNGRAAVRRLRALHVATGIAIPGIFAVAPFLPGDLGTPASFIAAIVLVLLVVLVVLAVVLAWQPTTGSRTRAAADPGAAERQRRQQEHEERTDRFRRLPQVALGLTAAALVVGAAQAPVRAAGTLPWLVGTVQWLFAVEAALLALLLVACLLLRPPRVPVPAPVCGPGGTPVVVAPAWGGLAMPGIALLAWVLAGGFSSGVILRAAQTLGTPVARDQRSPATYPIVVPTAYTWAAVGALVLGLVAGVCAVVTWWRVRRRSGEEFARSVAAVEAAYADAAPVGEDPAEKAPYERRRDAIAREWTAARTLSGQAQRVTGFLLVVTVVVVVTGAAGFLFVGPRLLSGAPLVVTAANLAISGFVLGLLAVGRQAYRNPATRRTVGILWDLGTFWPRAVHPLAPPCYAERAVPDLLLRLQYYAASGGRVLLSCHSQGSVLGAAVLLQVETAVSARTSFLTYGSPLVRLYGGFFPAYFSPAALERLGEFLADAPGPDGQTPDRTTWRWRNLYRPSDPIGGAVFCERDPAASGTDPGDVDPDDVDVALRDPVFARPPGDPCYPPVLGHSNYFADPALTATADALREGLLPRRRE